MEIWTRFVTVSLNTRGCQFLIKYTVQFTMIIWYLQLSAVTIFVLVLILFVNFKTENYKFWYR